MIRLIFPALLAILSLSSCDKILNAAKGMNRRPIADQIQISSPSKPQIVAAFEAISKATHEHNRVFLQNMEAGKPANELAYSAGIALLNRSAREHGGLAKRIIDAVAATCIHEKELFTPFDTIGRQLKGMPTWTRDAALQRRGYIQIIDKTIITYDEALAYLQRGAETLQRRNFDRQGVPGEISSEFLRLNRLLGKEIAEAKRGMFQEQRSALQCYREAMTAVDPAKANLHIAQARQHEQNAKQFESRMLVDIRRQMNASGML